MSSEAGRDVQFKSAFQHNPDNMPAREFSPTEKYVASIMMGLLFGLAIEKGRVFEPHIIREQMVFENFTMLKVFLSAAATSMMVFSVLTMVPSTQESIVKAWDNFARGLEDKTLLASATGSFITGVGMTLAGACPGMIYGQLGAGVPSAVYTLVGGVAGVLLYSYIHPQLPDSFTLNDGPAKRLDDHMQTPYFILALPFAACMGIVVFAVEEFVPWYTEVVQSGSEMFTCRSWAPFLSGAYLGILQLPAVTVLHTTIGSSTGLVTLVGQALKGRKELPYLRQYTSGIDNWWQVLYLGSAVVGAHLSSRASDTYASTSGVSPVAALTGGCLMLFGARMAGGCTSGHGLSGMAFLALHSLVAVPAMFGGGITTACLMKFVLGVPDLPRKIV